MAVEAENRPWDLDLLLGAEDADDANVGYLRVGQEERLELGRGDLVAVKRRANHTAVGRKDAGVRG